MFKSFAFVALCICIIINVSYAAVAIQPPVDTPPEFAGQEGCYNPDLNMVLPYEQPYSPADGKSCMQYTCQRNNYTQIFTCGVITVEPGEIVLGDKTLPYPRCCNHAGTTTSTTSSPISS